MIRSTALGNCRQHARAQAYQPMDADAAAEPHAVLHMDKTVRALLPADFLEATQEHYKFAVNAAIVDHEFGTREGSVHLAAAGIKPIRQQQTAPEQGCVPLQLLPPGWVVTTYTQPGPEVPPRRSSWGQQWGEHRSSGGAATDAEGGQYQWPGPEPVVQEMPKQYFGEVLHQLSQVSLLSQPRLLAAFSLYQMCFANVCHMQLVDTQMGELQRPVQLGAFLALQRLHLENMAELLQTEWAMKVRAAHSRACRRMPTSALKLQQQTKSGWCCNHADLRSCCANLLNSPRNLPLGDQP